MSSILVGRTRARSQAIQLLFQADVQSVDVYDLLARGDYALEDGPLDDYAAALARGVATNRIAIDRLIGGISHNWNLSRMPLVDRSIMAIAIYEAFDEPDVPESVAISEAVELSKVFGGDDSSAFVNGILGKVSKLAAASPELSLAQLAREVAAQAQQAAEEGQAEAEPDAAEGIDDGFDDLGEFADLEDFADAGGAAVDDAGADEPAAEPEDGADEL